VRRHVVNPPGRDSTNNPSERHILAEQNASGSDLTPSDSIDAPAFPSNPGVTSSSGQAPTDGWQEGFNPERMLPQYNLEPSAWSSLPEREQQGQASWISPTYDMPSQYQSQQGAPSHPSQYPMTPNTYLPSSHLRDSGRHLYSEQMPGHVEEAYDGYNRETAWVSANRVDRPNSGVLDRFSSSTHRRSVNNDWPSNESNFFEPQPRLSEPGDLANQSQSTSTYFLASKHDAESRGTD
jgi:hypothetical protein